MDQARGNKEGGEKGHLTSPVMGGKRQTLMANHGERIKRAFIIEADLAIEKKEDMG